jgi:hypothetical protein
MCPDICAFCETHNDGRHVANVTTQTGSYLILDSPCLGSRASYEREPRLRTPQNEPSCVFRAAIGYLPVSESTTGPTIFLPASCYVFASSGFFLHLGLSKITVLEALSTYLAVV